MVMTFDGQRSSYEKTGRCAPPFLYYKHIPSTVFTRNDAAASIIFTAVEGGDNSSYAGSEAREVFINTSSDISGVNK